MTDVPARQAGGQSRAGIARELSLVGYAAGNFGKNLLLSGADVTLLFMLTDLLGIAPASVGRLMILVFAGSVVFDLIIGLLVGLAQRKGLGYRAFVALGAGPCGAAFAMLYALPALGEKRFWVLAITLLAFRAAYAVIDVPHNSLLARVTQDSRARGRASGYRYFFSSMAGLAIALVLTPAVEHAASRAEPGALAELGLGAGLVFCIVMLISVGAAWTTVPGAKPSSMVILPKPDRLVAAMALIAFVTGFAMPMFGRSMLYFSTYVLRRPGFASEALTAVTLGQFAGVLLWTRLVHVREKTKVLAASHAVAAGGILAFALAGPHPAMLLGCAALTGIGLAGVFMLPWGILADVVDFAEFRHAERRETATFAGFLVIVKASGAASTGLIGWALAWLGYVPGVDQTPRVLAGIRLLAFGVPIIGSIAACLVLLPLSIGHRRHASVLAALRRRAKRFAMPALYLISADDRGRGVDREQRGAQRGRSAAQ